ncbi:MAG TPA: hypothetical protein VFB12_32125 [Ktedonobacteraceae bacterium]|nr:hypothetical protein [Ktedonobacteraceae bacterium]
MQWLRSLPRGTSRLVEQANPAAADLLRLCAFLDPDAIAEPLLTEGAHYLGEVLAPVVADPFAFNQAIEELLKFSLIRRNAERQVLSVHRLVQAVLKDAMPEEQQRQWAEHAVQMSAGRPSITCSRTRSSVPTS